jgi:hypothetical protein
MTRYPRTKWTRRMLLEEIAKYTTFTQFRTMSPRAYDMVMQRSDKDIMLAPLERKYKKKRVNPS